LKKQFKRILSCLFGGRRKVQFKGKKLGDNVQAKSSDLLVGSVANSVGTPLEFAAFRSCFEAKYSRGSAFWFFLSTTMVFTAFRTDFAQEKHQHFHVDRQLVTKKEISIKIKGKNDNERSWPTGLLTVP